MKEDIETLLRCAEMRSLDRRKTKAKPGLARDIKSNKKGFCCYINGKSGKESTRLLAKWAA